MSFLKAPTAPFENTLSQPCHSLSSTQPNSVVPPNTLSPFPVPSTTPGKACALLFHFLVPVLWLVTLLTSDGVGGGSLEAMTGQQGGLRAPPKRGRGDEAP